MARLPTRELAEIVRLQRGRHRRPQDGVCAMELVAWMAGERHSDHPRSASPVIAAFSRPFNDALAPAHRQRMGPLAARMLGTRGTVEQEAVRGQMLWDWMIATAVPVWLVAAGRPDLAFSIVAGRAGALDAANRALDANGHAYVRPVDDHLTASRVSSALAVAGVTAACIAGRDAADAAVGSRARRRWEAARVLARTAAWRVAEPVQPDLWRAAEQLRDSAFVLLDRLIATTEVAAPAPVGVQDVGRLTTLARSGRVRLPGMEEPVQRGGTQVNGVTVNWVEGGLRTNR
jgi:hypothetical protein